MIENEGKMNSKKGTFPPHADEWLLFYPDNERDEKDWTTETETEGIEE